MQGNYNYLGSRNAATYPRHTAHYEGILTRLEGVYKDVAMGVRVSKTEFKVISQNIFKTQIGSYEFLITFFGLWMFAQTSGSVLSLGAEFGDARVVSILILGIVSFLIPVILMSVLLPLQLFWEIRFWTIALATVVISAYSVSAVYIFALGPLHSARFGALIMPLLLIYGVTTYLGASRMSKIVCYSTFKERQKNRGIERHIPLNKSGELIVMSAQDHYVNLVTNAGEHLVRTSMKDAVADTLEHQGLQVHRSHWVAYAAIRDTKKNGERWFVILSNGMEIPVSKSKLAEVEAHLNKK